MLPQSKIIKHIKIRLNAMKKFNGITRVRNFGFQNAALEFLDSVIFREFKSLGKKIHIAKHLCIERYLCNTYSDIINTYQNADLPSDTYIPKQIWILWWQGVNQLPKTVRLCIQSVQYFFPDFKIRYLDQNNYSQYISLPGYILEKHRQGIITTTHLSDIIRVSLLAEYGGLWFDATIYFTQPIPPSHLSHPFYTLHHGVYTGQAARGIWSGYLIGTFKNNPFMQFMRDMFFAYWQKESYLIEYFLIDYIMIVGYDTIPFIKDMLDAVPTANAGRFNLQKMLQAPFDLEWYEQFAADTYIHKLTWKETFNETLPDGRQTLYGHLVQIYKDREQAIPKLFSAGASTL